MKSLDPRVNRLPGLDQNDNIQPQAPLDQLGTFEVFVQPHDGKPFQHEGAVHAPDKEMAFVLAKETFTRRFTCFSLYVVDTQDVYTSPMTEGEQNAYDQLPPAGPRGDAEATYEIYHLLKRGKQPVHAGQVQASSPQEAMQAAKEKLNTPPRTVYNIWAIRTSDIRFTTEEEKDLWLTLPEKKFRDAATYKGGDRLKEFTERSNSKA